MPVSPQQGAVPLTAKTRSPARAHALACHCAETFPVAPSVGAAMLVSRKAEPLACGVVGIQAYQFVCPMYMSPEKL